jgi:hypothetical protein
MITQKQQLLRFLLKMRDKQDFYSEKYLYFQNQINYTVTLKEK